MKQTRMGIIAAVVGFAGGCAHLPDATMRYYLAESKVSFKVVRTVTCDAGKHPIIVNSVTPTVTHSAARGTGNEWDLNFAELKGRMSDADVKFDFYEDGRIKSINATSTGQGETILKSMATLVAPALLFDGGAKSPQCDDILLAGNGKPITITYGGSVDVGNTKNAQEISPELLSADYANKFSPTIGLVCAMVGARSQPGAPMTKGGNSQDPVLHARQPGTVTIAVGTLDGTSCITTPDAMWSGSVPVAQFGTAYELPVPAPAPFGKQVFAATFAESGALTSVQYAQSNGTSQAVNAINTVLTTLQGETTAQELTRVKSEADLIAQQQRLAQCLADKANCK